MLSNLNVCHVWHAYQPIVGGLELTVQHLAEEQAKAGHDVSVLTSDACSTRSLGIEEVNNVKVRTLRSLKLFYDDLTTPLKYPEIEMDILHCHSQNSLFCLRIAEKYQKQGLPIIYQFLGVDYLEEHPDWLIRWLGLKYQRWIQEKVLKISDIIITPSPKDHEILTKKYNVESKIIPHGIGKEYLTLPSDANLFKDTYRTEEKNIIIYIGRLERLKGLHVLINSISLLKGTIEDVLLVIIGKGSFEYKKVLKEQVHKLGLDDFVIFLGYVSESMKISALDASMVLVLPSIAPFETFPLVINEAWSRGKPVIASEIGALPYRIRHAENGVLFQPGHSVALADSIEKVLLDKELRNKLGVCGKKELLSWERVSELTLRLYNEGLKR